MHGPFKDEMTRRQLLEPAKGLKRMGLSRFFNTRKPELPQPILVKLISNQLLQVLGITIWGVGSIPCDIHRWIENDEDVTCTIHTT